MKTKAKDWGSMLGQEVEYIECGRNGRGRVVRGFVVRQYSAELLNIDTWRHIPAVRFVIRCADGREIETNAMACVQ